MVWGKGSNFILLHVGTWLSQPAPFVEKTILFPLTCSVILLEKQLVGNVSVYNLDSQFYSIDLHVYPYMCITLSWLVQKFWNQEVWGFHLILSILELLVSNAVSGVNGQYSPGIWAHPQGCISGTQTPSSSALERWSPTLSAPSSSWQVHGNVLWGTMISLSYFKHHFNSSPPPLLADCSYWNSVLHSWIINELGVSQEMGGGSFQRTRWGARDKLSAEVFPSPGKVIEFP